MKDSWLAVSFGIRDFSPRNKTDYKFLLHTQNIMVFTHGSPILTGVGAPIPATKVSGLTHQLGENNYMFQAKFFSISKTLEWISHQNNF